MLRRNPLLVYNQKFTILIVYIIILVLSSASCSGQFISHQNSYYVYNNSSIKPNFVYGGSELTFSYEFILTEQSNYNYITLRTEIVPIEDRPLWNISREDFIDKTLSNLSSQGTVIKFIPREKVTIKITGIVPYLHKKEQKDVLLVGLTEDPSQTKETIYSEKVLITSVEIEEAEKKIVEVEKIINNLTEQNYSYGWIMGFYQDFNTLAKNQKDAGYPWICNDILTILLNETRLKEASITPPTLKEHISKIFFSWYSIPLYTVLCLFILALYYIRLLKKELELGRE